MGNDFGSNEEHQKYLREVYEESLLESSEIYNECDGDLLDLDLPVAVPLFPDGLHSIRNAEIKHEKLYLDVEETNIRYTYENKSEGNIRNEATLLLNSDEKRLSDIITQLPYGLIDKQVTGIGATHLEMYYSERNSIIVVPTRALGESKSMKDPNRFLYVGTKKSTGKVTDDNEIKEYLNNPDIRFKKILVVADSLKRVIISILKNREDVYHDYFLMVDEIDTIQSDNHFRPQLSDVIDYYYKFKLQRRALVSATVKEFTHPKLQEEPLTTIKNAEPLKRKINLLCTNNVTLMLVTEVIKIVSRYPSEKILIAYNSIESCLDAICLLQKKVKSKCGILCSDASYDKVEQQLRAYINEEDILSHEIVFMTCAFFAGIDIKDQCHLITVSSVQKGYTLLPINKMTQIHGRCRYGILTDTIIYNITKEPFKYRKNYRENLAYKSQKVIDLLKAADNIKKGDEDLEDLFYRIQTVIIDKANESFFSRAPISLVRENIEREWEISYFNIDVLFEQMESYSSLYAQKDDLYNVLKESHIVDFKEKTFDKEEDSKEDTDKIEKNKDAIKSKIQNCIIDLLANKEQLNDKELDSKIRHAKREERNLYIRVKELYQYIEIEELTSKLNDICTENIVSYKSLKNAIYFWALDTHHPFKAQIFNSFEIGKKYSSKEIAEHMSVIVKDQLFKNFSIEPKLLQSKLVRFFKSLLDYTYTGGEYILKGYKSERLKKMEPLKVIDKKEPASKYFEI